MQAPKKSSVPHGTFTRYIYGCRCPDCKKARLEYEREKTARQRERARIAQENMLPELHKEKRCPLCGETKPLEGFRRDSRRIDGRARDCKACRAEIAKQQYTTEKGRRGYYKVAYGITPEQFDEMLAAQGGVCAICGRTDSTSKIDPSKAKHKSIHRLHIDHDHETGEIRALLCGTCNRGIGSFHEDPELLRAAAAYLQRFAETILLDAEDVERVRVSYWMADGPGTAHSTEAEVRTIDGEWKRQERARV